MGYYDDWVDPNAFFPTAFAKMGARVRSVPKTHLEGPRGCGVEVRNTDDPSRVTCQGCLEKMKDHG